MMSVLKYFHHTKGEPRVYCSRTKDLSSGPMSVSHPRPVIERLWPFLAPSAANFAAASDEWAARRLSKMPSPDP